jgi:acyl carrier protein
VEHKDQIRNFIVSNFYVTDAATLADDTSLLESGIVDSTGILEIITFLESDLGITVADTEMMPENLDSVSRLVAYVQKKKKQQQA